MKSNAATAALLIAPLLSASFAKDLVECKYGVELLHLQDVTETFGAYKDEMVIQMSNVITSVSQKYQDSKFGYSIFGDKPLLSMGWGDSDSCAANLADDMCYLNSVPMTNDEELVLEAIRNTVITGGKDYDEGQLEGLIRAAQDPNLGWGSHSSTVELIKVVVLVTDDRHHSAGHAQLEVEWWRRDYGLSYQFCKWQMADQGCIPDCLRAGELRLLAESGKITSKEQKEFDRIQKYVGPANPPDMLPHPGFGVFGNDGCATYDYPTVEQVAQVVNGNQVKVIVLHAGDHGEEQYRDLVTHFDAGVFMKMAVDASNVANLIDAAVEEILSKECIESTTSSTSSTKDDIKTTAVEAHSSTAAANPTTVAGSFQPITVPGYVRPTAPISVVPTTVAGSFQPITVPGYVPPTAPIAVVPTTVAGSFQPITVPGYVRPTAPIAVVPTTVAGSFQPITVPGYVRPTAPITVVPTTVAGSFQPITVPGYVRPTAPIAVVPTTTPGGVPEGSSGPMETDPTSGPAENLPVTLPATIDTTDLVILPPAVGVPPSGGVSTGVIVGSAAAGAAVVAAAAAWFTGGFGLAGAAPGAAVAGTNVEVPEVSVEREAAEAIDMDMFA